MLFALSVALAAEPAPVLVSGFQPASTEAVGLAALLEGYLAVALEGDASIRLLRVEDTPPFEDYDSRVYIDGCPEGDIIGCTTVIAQRAAVAFAVTGTVRVVDGTISVDLAVLDIGANRVAVQFQSELPEGDDKAFAEAVVKVLVAAVNGEIGQDVDIRDNEDAPVARDNSALARQIEELQDELGAAQVELSRPERSLPRTEYTVEKLSEDMQGEGLKPWERLDMRPGDYLRYKNSGFSLVEWRRRAVGRAGQILLRPTVGFVSGPVDGGYYGAFGVDDTLAVVDSWSAQSIQSGRGVEAAFGAGYGILPFLELGVEGGIWSGHFSIEVKQQQIGDFEEPSEPMSYQQVSGYGGLRAIVAPFPVLPVRPRLGVGVDFAAGRSSTHFLQLPPELTTFSARSMLLGKLLVGGEARINRRVDFVLDVPLTLVASTLTDTARVSDQEVVDPVVPTPASAVGWGIRAGLQIRLLGKDTESTSLLDEMDEP